MKQCFSLVVILLLSACAIKHHDDVRPHTSGVHTIVLQTEDKHEGYGVAWPQAQYFCSKQQKMAYIVNEEYQYTGAMDEKDYHMAKAAAKIAKEAGSTAWVFGQGDTEKTGAIAAAGGRIAENAIGPGYTYTMKFQCQ